MQIVIPMSGFGERFRAAGYKVPKPIINVDQKCIIEHVIELFPGETDFIFICNQEHLDTPEFRMREILQLACPSGRVVGIEPHKLGPVYAVQQIYDLLDADRPVVVNYCDFSQFWDWDKFQSFVRQTDCDGCIPSYRGFHPHSLNSTFYAYLKLDREENWLVDIQEKKPWTEEPINEFASSGTYYFKSAGLMRDYFDLCVAEGLHVNGEFYVSMVYRPMVLAGLKVNAFPLEYFMQWGTPNDLLAYQNWDRLFREYQKGLPPRNDLKVAGSIVIPMAGQGSRFLNAGYKVMKPLIPVGSETMIERAVQDMPMADELVVVTRADLPGNDAIIEILVERFEGIRVATMDGLSEGQAISCLRGVEALPKEAMGQPLTIAACDNGVIFDSSKLVSKMEVSDCVVWTYRGHPAAKRNPNSYSWVIADDDDKVERIEVKQLSADPKSTPIVIGAFTFRTAEVYQQAVETLVEQSSRVNGEFYADSVPNILIEIGMSVTMLEVDHFVCFGTPDELKTYEYWYDCFSKWASHPLQRF